MKYTLNIKIDLNNRLTRREKYCFLLYIDIFFFKIKSSFLKIKLKFKKIKISSIVIDLS
jgi:hypothetical protein